MLEVFCFSEHQGVVSGLRYDVLSAPRQTATP